VPNSPSFLRPGLVQARRALYYPYIHPRDIEWVKGTLLSFGQINRIVPHQFPLEDSEEVAWLRDQRGPDGEPLICGVSLDWPDIQFARERLSNVLSDVDPKRLKIRFGQRATLRQFGSDEGFEIHGNKLNHDLIFLLSRMELIWRNLRRHGSSFHEWWAVHPVVGEVIMSVIAIAAARHKGLDIVTDSMTLHAALVSLDEQQILRELLGPVALPAPAAVPAPQLVNQLGHVVMTTMVDLRRLTVKDVAKIVQNGDDLSGFRDAVSRVALDMPPEVAPNVREEMMHTRAEKVVREWEKYRRSAPRKLRQALLDTTAEESRKELQRAGDAIATALASAGTAGVATLFSGSSLHTAALSVGVGLAIGLILTTGRKILSRNSDDPYPYLSRIENAGATILTIPRQSLPQTQLKCDCQDKTHLKKGGSRRKEGAR